MKSYSEFRDAVGLRESSDNYGCVNSLGYLGRYQFGMARLCDLGVTKRIDPESHSLAASAFEWVEGQSKEKFLVNRALQDQCFDRHVQKLKRDVVHIAGAAYPNLSGAIGGCHLLGPGGFMEYLHGHDGADAFGTRFSDYLALFAGFEIP